MRKPTTSAAAGKPAKPSKPYEGFPLFAHASGRWCKKIRGQFVYFGKWDDWQAALAKYHAQADDLNAGRKPRKGTEPEGLTVQQLCNKFLTDKRAKVLEGTLTPRSFADHVGTARRFADSVGKFRLAADLLPEDFAKFRSDMLTKRKIGHVTLANEIRRVKCMFHWGRKNKHLPSLEFGTAFEAIKGKDAWKVAAPEADEKVFCRDEVRAMLDAAPIHMKAMLLLAVNCAYGNSDIAQLRISSLDLDGGWVAQRRSKTGVRRRAKLWPETVTAIRASLERRAEPADDDAADLLFLTRTGQGWLPKPRFDSEAGTYKNVIGAALASEFRKLLKSIDRAAAKAAKKEGRPAPAKLYRKRVGFYSLRHTFRSVADQTLDHPACNMVMGHSDKSVQGIYTHNNAPAVRAMFDKRLKAVAEFVRSWLWPPIVDQSTESRGVEVQP